MKRACSEFYHITKRMSSEQHVTIKNNRYKHMKRACSEFYD